MSNCYYDYEELARLDPFELDAIFSNSTWGSNLDRLNILLRHCVECLQSMKINPSTALACMRDLEFIVAAARTFGGENLLMNNAPAVDALKQLAAIAETVPRGTVYTYAGINPKEGRQRTFTSDPAEISFIGSVRQSIIDLDRALYALALPAETDQIVIEEKLAILLHALTQLVTNMVNVGRHVSPQFFTGTLRKYFDPIIVEDIRYLGPGGAQLPLLAIDYIVWGGDLDDERYKKFVFENLAYLMPKHRQAMYETVDRLNGRSIFTVCKEKNIAAPALRGILQKLRSFRYPHLKVANENFKLRPDSAVGSGAYRPDILQHIVTLMEARADELP